jgi:hypothetical protein
MTVTVELLKARWQNDQRTPDRGAFRSRLATVLEGADLEPRGLPPGAVLVVRRVSDPLPGGMDLWKAPYAARSAWERAARGALEECCRHAARPVNGNLAAEDSQAVLFASLAELRACLALDFARGQASSRWWWQSLVRQSGPENLPGGASSGPDNIYNVLAASPEQLPAVIHHLAEWNQAVPVLARLDGGQCARLARAAAQAYVLPWPETELYEDFQPGTTLPGEGSRPDNQPDVPVGENTPSVEPADEIPTDPREHAARLLRQLSPAHPGLAERLEPSQAALLVLCLGLQRQPRLARTRAFLQTAARALQAAPSIHMSRPADGVPARPTPPEKAHLLTDNLPVINEETPQREEERSAPSSPVELRWDDQGLVTRLGGAWYLINLIDALGLPDCFASHPPLAQTSSPWDVLALLALGLAGSRIEAFAADPTWSAIRQLDGRGEDRFHGDTVTLSAEYCLPAPWFGRVHAAGPARPLGCCWAERDGMLWLWADEGFLIAATARTINTPTGQAQEIIHQYLEEDAVIFLSQASTDDIPLAQLDPWLEQRLSPGAAQWLRCALPYLNLLLRAAMRLDWDADLFQPLLAAPAQLYLTSTHVDLVMPLDAISTAARLAGLDRDPGWQPAFGRVIQFHYEPI